MIIGGGRRPVDGVVGGRVHRTEVVDGVADHVEDAAQGPGSDRNEDGGAGRHSGDSALEAVGAVHRNGPHPAIAHVLLDFQNKRRFAFALDFDRFKEFGGLTFGKFHVHHTTEDLRYAPDCFCHYSASKLLSQRVRAAHDIQQLFRDRFLAGLVIGQGQVADQIVGRVGGVAHGDHAGGMF